MRNPLTSLVRRVAATAIQLTRRDFLAVFNYHQVSPKFEPKYHLRSTWTELAHFERQVLELRSRFNVVRLPDAIRQIKDGTLRGPCVALTFDDGDISLERYVTPVLAKYRVPATYFINSGYWGARRTYWVYLFGYLAHNEDKSKRAILSNESKSQFGVLRNTTDPAQYHELRERIEANLHLVDQNEQLFVPKNFLASLDPELFSVALHGHEHQRFSMMPEAWQRQSLEKNVAELSSLPGYCPVFGVPFGRPHDWNDTVIRICNDMRLDVAFANGGINRPGDTYCQRMPADGSRVSAVLREGLVGW